HYSALLRMALSAVVAQYSFQLLDVRLTPIDLSVFLETNAALLKVWIVSFSVLLSLPLPLYVPFPLLYYRCRPSLLPFSTSIFELLLLFLFVVAAAVVVDVAIRVALVVRLLFLLGVPLQLTVLVQLEPLQCFVLFLVLRVLFALSLF
ncbi:hypothetical protein, partial [Staphylococcus pseudintermedius]|uniref:hypothetical protein n=1 Tax=Staphylococcus pseudintermedius TaxID=283734 RepID=UPI001CA34728